MELNGVHICLIQVLEQNVLPSLESGLSMPRQGAESQSHSVSGPHQARRAGKSNQRFITNNAQLRGRWAELIVPRAKSVQGIEGFTATLKQGD